MSDEKAAGVDWKRSYYAEADKSDALRKECAELRKDALLGRFVRRHMVELGGGWQINQTFIAGAPSIEDVTDALPDVG